MSSNPRGERQVTHFADEHTLARLAELERQLEERAQTNLKLIADLAALREENAELRGKNHTTLNDYREECRMRQDLERENAELRRKLGASDERREALRMQLRTTQEKLQIALARVAELRRDKERLDWIQENEEMPAAHCPDLGGAPGHVEWIWNGIAYDCLRAAIDAAAMQEDA